MSREIKFRVYYPEVKPNKYTAQITRLTIDKEGKSNSTSCIEERYTELKPAKMKTIDLDEQHHDTTEFFCARTYGVVMQYIGDKDKDGAEIYEGDITQLIYADGKQGPIGFVEYELFRYIIRTNESNNMLINYNALEPGSFFYGQGLKVIGNIYQNPELLTNQNK